MHLTKYNRDNFFLKDINHVLVDGADVFFADASDVDVVSVIGFLSEQRKEKISKMKKEDAKKLSAGAELLLIYALNLLGFEKSLKYCTDERGKLYFADTDGLYFNLSHSGKMVACVIARSEAGIDIEAERKEKTAIAEKYFNSAEKQQIEQGLNDFTRIWVRKEAVAKADGRGIAAGLKDIDVSDDVSVFAGEEYHLHDIDVPDGEYKLSVAVRQ